MTRRTSAGAFDPRRPGTTAATHALTDRKDFPWRVDS
jgi:hypothetical protein